MVFNWEAAPLLRILLPLVIGILLFINFEVPTQFLSITLLLPIAICFMILFVLRRQKWAYRFRWIFGTLLALALIMVGFERTKQTTEILQKEHFSRFLSDSSLVLMQLEAPLEEKEKTFKAEVKILQVANGNQIDKVIGKALVYFQKSEDVSELKYGDVVLTSSTFRKLEGPKNPHGFDYAAYMQNFQVYHQSYVTTDKWQKTDKNYANSFYQKVYQTRAYFLKIIEEKVGSPAEIGVASAILLGYKANLDDQVRDTYANTGAMHILAVSGLHVGIIFILINNLLFFLEKIHKRGKILKFFLVITVIWGYAFITGLPPSVSRAATMFTIFAIGELWNRKSFSFNALAASALLLLCYNPYMIKMVGFQLSYAAVAAIMWLQGPIYRIFQVKNYLLDYIWKISAVSIAAQLGTAPLSVYYFHQFPTYFWLSNLVVIPAAGIILMVGVGLLVLSSIPYVGSFLGNILGIVLQGLINAVYNALQIIQWLPFSVIEGLVVSDLQFWLLYGGMMASVLFFIFHHLKYLQWTLVAMLLMSVTFAWQQFQSVRQKQMVVYHLPKQSAVEFIVGDESYIIGNESLLQEKDNETFQYNIAPHQLMSSIAALQIVPFPAFHNEASTPNCLFFDPPFIQFCNKKILLLNDSTSIPADLEKKMKVDYLILSNNPRISLQKALDWLDFQQVIFDASNNYKQVSRWKSECELHGLKCHNVYEQGAFVVDF
ncbi:MAG: ComEC/Rec2 family competence protein [Chitinophagales bacterium]